MPNPQPPPPRDDDEFRATETAGRHRVCPTADLYQWITLLRQMNLLASMLLRNDRIVEHGIEGEIRHENLHQRRAMSHRILAIGKEVDPRGEWTLKKVEVDWRSPALRCS